MRQITVFLYILLLIAVCTDLKKGKIPNYIIIIGITTGIFTTDNLTESMIQSILITLILFPLFSIKALGAGDIKCIAMTGFYLDTGQFIKSIQICFIIAGIFSFLKIFQIICQKSFREKIYHFFFCLKFFLIGQKNLLFETLSPDTSPNTKNTIHLALPIFLGVLISSNL